MMRFVSLLLIACAPAFAADVQTEADVRLAAVVKEIIAQRDAAQGRAVQLAAELAVAQRQCKPE